MQRSCGGRGLVSLMGSTRDGVAVLQRYRGPSLRSRARGVHRGWMGRSMWARTVMLSGEKTVMVIMYSE